MCNCIAYESIAKSMKFDNKHTVKKAREDTDGQLPSLARGC